MDKLQKGDRAISRDRDRDNRDKEPRINRAIRAREVRLISQSGEQLGIQSTFRALEMAEEEGVDLVEVAPNARPPVCKLLDYGKFKYEQKRKIKEQRKNSATNQLKEVKFRPKTDDHDVAYKVKNIKRFLSEGSKTKVTVMFRGREITHKDRGRMILDRVIQELGEDAIVERQPSMEGRTMMLIVAPRPNRGNKDKARAESEE